MRACVRARACACVRSRACVCVRAMHGSLLRWIECCIPCTTTAFPRGPQSPIAVTCTGAAGTAGPGVGARA
ncbi:hypothetical protein EVAR_67221_1 [Eumeta japonica]|uniref:Uncharacterized protein n=1 Tax=Eumeta variegata TaxID=151549 RepID=A0A4C2A7B6_EUMVA|nr:hypothetical protein EVAR_67221_1 [Eumeta japonica]